MTSTTTSTSTLLVSNKDLLENFTKIQSEDNFGFLQIKIDFDANSFQLIKNENKKANENETWKAIQALLEDKNHSYFITCDPINPKLYIIIHFSPDSASVKQRMLYASSRATLKAQLGSSYFSDDYHISRKEECNINILKEQRDLNKRIDYRNESEIAKAIGNQNTAPKSVRGQVVNTLAIQMTDAGIKAIESYKTKQTKCVFLSLTEDNQAIQGEEQKAQNIDEIKELIPENEPRFVLFLYSKSTEKNSEPRQIFGYYCPEKGNRKLKFTYSMCKTNVIQYCKQQQIDFFAKVEIGDLSEISSEFLDYNVFPDKQEKEKFGIPKMPGKKAHKKKGK